MSCCKSTVSFNPFPPSIWYLFLHFWLWCNCHVVPTRTYLKKKKRKANNDDYCRFHARCWIWQATSYVSQWTKNAGLQVISRSPYISGFTLKKKKKKKWVAYDTTSQDWRQDKLFHMASVLGRTVSWLVVCGFRSAKFHHHLSGAYPLEKPSRYYLFGPEMLMCAIIIDINLTVRGPIVQYSNTINTQITTSPYLWTIGK